MPTNTRLELRLGLAEQTWNKIRSMLDTQKISVPLGDYIQNVILHGRPLPRDLQPDAVQAFKDIANGEEFGAWISVTPGEIGRSLTGARSLAWLLYMHGVASIAQEMKACHAEVNPEWYDSLNGAPPNRHVTEDMLRKESGLDPAEMESYARHRVEARISKDLAKKAGAQRLHAATTRLRQEVRLCAKLDAEERAETDRLIQTVDVFLVSAAEVSRPGPGARIRTDSPARAYHQTSQRQGRLCPAVPESLLEDMSAGRVVPFIGAGISRAAEVEGAPLPSYEELAIHLRDRAANARSSIDPRDGPDVDLVDKLVQEGKYFDAIAEVGNNTPDVHYVRWVRGLLNPILLKPSQHHVLLNLLPFPFYITTNYDRVLENVIYPLPEVVTYRDIAMSEVLLRERRKFIFKLNGDLTRANELALGRTQDSKSLEELEEFLVRIFRSHSILFLGCSLADTEYMRLLNRIVSKIGRTTGPHYALISTSESPPKESIDLARDLNIGLLGYELESETDKGHHAVWQFLSQLKPPRAFSPAAGSKTGEFFTLSERSAYLSCQRELEAGATALRYMTPSLSNAIATEEYIEVVCRAKLTKFESELCGKFSSWSDEVIEGMQDRRIQLDSLISGQCEFRVLCLAQECLKDAQKVQSGDQSAQLISDRYQKVLRLVEDADVDVEIRLSEVAFEDSEKHERSFASILRPHEKGADVAVAYATQATTQNLLIHLIEMNTRYAEERLTLFEREWARALDEQESHARLRRWFPETKTTNSGAGS